MVFGPDIYHLVGRRLQALRKAHGLTQNELAEKADVAVSYVVKLEGGTRRIQLETLVRIADVLGEPIAAFFVDRRPPPSEEKWRGEAAKLIDLIRDLDDEDVRSLVGVARRLARS